jgi:hypothetical protein
MSKIKTPEEKKRKSYEHDGRNSYGEHSKSSRKNIARGRQRVHMAERRVAEETLRALGPSPDEPLAEDVEGAIKTRTREQRLGGFKKSPDLPLGEMLKRKEERRKRVADRTAK